MAWRNTTWGQRTGRTHHYLKVHLVFGTKLRMPWITRDLHDPLYERVHQIVADQDEILEALGGIEDHVHLLLRIRPTTKLAGLVKLIKGASAHWVNQRPNRLDQFGWQEGYVRRRVRNPPSCS